MHVYDNGAWTEGFLDVTPTPGFVRVEVHRQVALSPAQEQFFVRRPDLAMMASYLRMLGPRRVARKVISRRAESTRNDAWLSVGLGRTEAGDSVVFVSTAGPRAAERVVVPEALCAPAAADFSTRGIAHYEPMSSASAWSGVPDVVREALAPLGGWNPEEGSRADVAPSVFSAIESLILDPPGGSFGPLAPAPAPSAVTERTERTERLDAGGGVARPAFHLFGYGQYAKTQVISNLGRHLELVGVHEINPLQIGADPDPGVAWDTSGWPREDEAIRNVVVAGYHHTHAPLAVHFLDHGARHVVIEKPIATSTEQLDALTSAMSRNPDSRVHVAFQRRYSPFNAALRADLGDGPVSVSATVFEVPLPARHWYRWPVVGNAVVSNGCHWIDYFLFLNGSSPAVALQADRLGSQILLGIELANGASCSISLRHEGAPRRGVRDHSVLWSDDVSVTIEDLRRYTAERGFRQVRRRNAHPYRCVEDMYLEFGRRIELDLPGDDVEGLRASGAVTLELARLLDLAR